MIRLKDEEFLSEHCAWYWQHVKIGSATFRKNFPGETPSQNLWKIRDWCNENESSAKYFSSVANFYFEKPEDATLFALRWS